jgi:hypothetical protein
LVGFFVCSALAQMCEPEHPAFLKRLDAHSDGTDRQPSERQHQLNVALRHASPRVRLRGGDHAFMVWMVRLWPSLLEAGLDQGLVGAERPIDVEER